MPARPQYTKHDKDINLKAVPRDLYNALAAAAEAEHSSLRGYILRALEEHVKQQNRNEQHRGP